MLTRYGKQPKYLDFQHDLLRAMGHGETLDSSIKLPSTSAARMRELSGKMDTSEGRENKLIQDANSSEALPEARMLI